MEEVVENNGIPTTYGEKVDPPRGYGGHIKAIKDFEIKKIGESIEHIIATDFNGNSFGESTQEEKKSVRSSPEVWDRINKYVKKNGNYSIIQSHNHPGYTSFSSGDISNFISKNFLFESRVSTKFYTYVIQKPKNRLDNLKIPNEKINNIISDIDPDVEIGIQKIVNNQRKYWMKKWREAGDSSDIKLNEKFKGDPKYSIFLEATHKASFEVCKTYGILYSRYETDFTPILDDIKNEQPKQEIVKNDEQPQKTNEEVKDTTTPSNKKIATSLSKNEEVKETKVEISKSDIIYLTEKKNITDMDKKQVVIDDRYDILTVLDTRDVIYESTMFRKPYPFEDFESFNKKKIQEKKQEYDEIGIDEKKKTIIETRNLTVRRKAKLKGETGAIGTMPKREDYSYIPIGRVFGAVVYGITTFGGTGTNEPYTGERRKNNKLKVTDPSTQSYNGWPVLFTKEQQKEFLVSDKLPGLKPNITCTKQVLPIFYNLIYDLHKSVEPLKSTSCFNVRRATLSQRSWSCHASGTAIDFNHPWHPLYHSNTFKPNQVTQIQKLIKRYGIRWGGDFKDDMHFEINITQNEAQLLIQKLNLVDRMNKIKSGINVPVE